LIITNFGDFIPAEISLNINAKNPSVAKNYSPFEVATYLMDTGPPV